MYLNDPKAAIKADGDLKELFQSIKLPNDMLDIEKDLQKNGMKPATYTAKRGPWPRSMVYILTQETEAAAAGDHQGDQAHQCSFARALSELECPRFGMTVIGLFALVTNRDVTCKCIHIPFPLTKFGWWIVCDYVDKLR